MCIDVERTERSKLADIPGYIDMASNNKKLLISTFSNLDSAAKILTKRDADSSAKRKAKPKP